MKVFILVLLLGAGLALLISCSPQGKAAPGQTSEKTPEKTLEQAPGKMSEQGKAVPGKMTGARLTALITKIDENAEVNNNIVSFKIKERELVFVFDGNANRMRLMTPIAPAGSVPPDIYKRMLQANYDSVLDPRYAVANNLIWAAYVHPLVSLTEEDFLSAMVQTYTAAETFGSSYSSGAVVFGNGDSNTLHQELLKELEGASKAKDRGI